MEALKMRYLILFINILLLMVVTTACIPSDPNFNRLVCQNGVIKLVPSDNTVEVLFHSLYACGVSFDDESKYNTLSYTFHNSVSNGSFQLIDQYTAKDDYTIPHQCAWLPSANRSNFENYDVEQCGYENPDYVVLYCNENDEPTISEKTCAEYMDTPEGEFIP